MSGEGAHHVIRHPEERALARVSKGDGPKFFRASFETYAFALRATAASALANNKTYFCILAARFARGLQILFALDSQRAQGMPDARCTRGLVCNVHKEVRT